MLCGIMGTSSCGRNYGWYLFMGDAMNNSMISFAKDQDGEDCYYLDRRGNLEIAAIMILVVMVAAFVVSPFFVPQYVNWNQVIWVTVSVVLLAALGDTINSKEIKKFLETV